ncbi:MAG: conjugal transfer protein TraX [Lachnospiraceae bacterium]|nr:conjugal transfer protein TraX [Lachnospiraceae bacterium]
MGLSLNGKQLKILACVFMLTDHVGAAIFETAHLTVKYPWANTANQILRGVGRLALPIYIFLLIEGFVYTKNRVRYGLSLLLLALISEIPFDLCFYRVLTFNHQNTIFMLLIGYVTIWGMHLCLKQKNWHTAFQYLKYPSAFLSAFYIAFSLFFKTEIRSTIKTLSGFLGHEIDAFAYTQAYRYASFAIGLLAVIVLFFILRKKTNDEACSILYAFSLAGLGVFAGDMARVDYLGYGVLAVVLAYVFRFNYARRTLVMAIPLTLHAYDGLISFFTVAFTDGYTGTRGNIRHKYLFYIFYPAHIMVLMTVRMVVFKI